MTGAVGGEARRGLAWLMRGVVGRRGGGWRTGRDAKRGGPWVRSFKTEAVGCAWWRRASGARAGEAACEARAPAATGRRRWDARDEP